MWQGGHRWFGLVNKILTLILFFQIRKKAALTEAEKEEAEKLKVEGNELMRTEQFDAAIEKYSKWVTSFFLTFSVTTQLWALLKWTYYL